MEKGKVSGRSERAKTVKDTGQKWEYNDNKANEDAITAMWNWQLKEEEIVDKIPVQSDFCADYNRKSPN